MLARIRKSMEEKDQGFTLIELLVVMIIIGILAAIAIPVFLNQRQAAREASAKADVTNIGKEVVSYYVDGTAGLTVSGSVGAWKANDGTNDVATGTLSASNKVTDTAVTSGTSYCIEVTSFPSAADAAADSNPDTPWVYTQNGLKQGTTPGAGC